MQVKSGDAVVAVNGKRGSADQLLEQVAKGMKVTILRNWSLQHHRIRIPRPMTDRFDLSRAQPQKACA
eukprot:g2949.t1